MRLISFDLGVRNLACAQLSWDGDPSGPITLVSVEDVDILQEAGSSAGNANKVPYELILKCILNYVMSRADSWNLKDLTAVIFESQVKKNPRCKTAMYIMMAWFTAKYLEAGLTHRTMPKILKISAKNKLTVQGTGVTGLPVPKAGPKGQRQRKKNAAAMMTSLVNGNGRPFVVAPDVKEILLEAKKKDDMSDAILQAIWYIDGMNEKVVAKEAKKRKSSDEPTTSDQPRVKKPRSTKPKPSEETEVVDVKPAKKPRAAKKAKETEGQPESTPTKLKKPRAPKKKIVSFSGAPDQEGGLSLPKKRSVTSKRKRNDQSSPTPPVACDAAELPVPS